jgi:hypothetical protein
MVVGHDAFKQCDEYSVAAPGIGTGRPGSRQMDSCLRMSISMAMPFRLSTG